MVTMMKLMHNRLIEIINKINPAFPSLTGMSVPINVEFVITFVVTSFVVSLVTLFVVSVFKGANKIKVKG